MYSTVDIMDGCEYYREIIIVPLKEHIAGSIFLKNFLERNILLNELL